MIKLFINSWLILCAVFFVTSCTTAKQLSKATPLSFLKNDTNFNVAHYGVALYKPATNTYLIQHNSQQLFVPASNTKILTCYASLKNLGDSLLSIQYYETDTSFHVLGVANPINMHQDYKQQPTISFLKNQTKKIYLHNNYFDAEGLGFGWAWDDYEATYMTERSFFPLYSNLVVLKKDSIGFTAYPTYFSNKIANNNINNQQGFDVSRQLASNELVILNGKNNNPKQITFSTQNPKSKEGLQLACNLLSEAIEKPVFAGNNFNKQAAKNLYNYPTDTILKAMMHTSDNFFAEQLLLMSSYSKLGYINDGLFISDVLKTDLNNMPQKPRWVDGSGLSRYNLLSPEDLIYVLNKIKNENSWGRIQTIFATGDEGTLKGLYKNYSNNIFAKTGTLSGHVALSGYLITKKGEELIFSVLVNNHNTTATAIRKTIEKMIVEIIETY